MHKEYKVKKVNNGFLVEFNHLPSSWKEENLRIAVTLEEVVAIIQTDLQDILKMAEVKK